MKNIILVLLALQLFSCTDIESESMDLVFNGRCKQVPHLPDMCFGTADFDPEIHILYQKYARMMDCVDAEYGEYSDIAVFIVTDASQWLDEIDTGRIVKGLFKREAGDIYIYLGERMHALGHELGHAVESQMGVDFSNAHGPCSLAVNCGEMIDDHYADVVDDYYETDTNKSIKDMMDDVDQNWDAIPVQDCE